MRVLAARTREAGVGRRSFGGKGAGRGGQARRDWPEGAGSCRKIQEVKLSKVKTEAGRKDEKREKKEK